MTIEETEAPSACTAIAPGSAGGNPLWPDVVSGLCVAGLLLPEAVAYAGLAHVQVAHALTATVVGLVIYALWGRSRFAIVTPTSSTATLAAAAVVSMAGMAGQANALAYNQVFFALVLVTGLMLMVLALAHQGQLSTFISRPVLRGFAFALATTIVIKQLPDALGFTLPPGVAPDPAPILLFVMSHGSLWHPPSMAVALVAALTIVALRRWPQVPASMLVMVLAIAAAYRFQLSSLGIHGIGQVEPITWQFEWPQLPFGTWLRTSELAFGLVMLVFAESWGSMRTMALSHGDSVDANRELMVLGACNAGSALLQGMPVGAGFSATSANAAAGAVSKKSGVIALVAVAAVLMLALPSLSLLPRPVLAVAVINALWHSLSPKPLLSVWHMNRDRMLVIGAVLAVLLLGVLDGMLAAIGLSVLAALQRFSQPVLHELGELGASRNYVDIHTQREAAARPGLLILRPEEPLFFASAERVVAEVMVRVRKRQDLTAVILSLEESADLDSTAVECLLELKHSLAAIGINLLLARVKTSVRDLLVRWDPEGLGKADTMFWSVADAVQFLTG
jgi:sulfate permease, SulP family